MMTDVMVEVKKRVKEEIEDLLDCDHWTSVHAATLYYLVKTAKKCVELIEEEKATEASK